MSNALTTSLACFALLATNVNLSYGAQSPTAEDAGAVNQNRAAFSMARDTSYGPFKEDAVIPFEVEFANHGGHFDITTGIYTVPIKGFYILMFNVYKNELNEGGPMVFLMVNDVIILRADECCTADDWDSASNGLILPLNAGDEIYLLLAAGRIASGSGFRETTFTGALLF
ncbi:caprin-2-like [Glandiceps talaboti]